jgi:hypothetical protein
MALFEVSGPAGRLIEKPARKGLDESRARKRNEPGEFEPIY